MRFFQKHQFPDGSTLEPFFRESLIYQKGLMKTDVDFVRNDDGCFHAYIDSKLRWHPNEEHGFVGLSELERDEIAQKVSEYCEKRIMKYVIHR